MGNKKESPKNETAVAVTETDSVESAFTDTESGEVMNEQQMIESLKTARKGVQVNARYHEWQPGEKVRAVFIGHAFIPATMKGSEKQSNAEMTVPAVKFFTENNETIITAAAVLVSTCSGYKRGAKFLIECTGKEKNDKGSYFTFNINELI